MDEFSVVIVLSSDTVFGYPQIIWLIVIWKTLCWKLTLGFMIYIHYFFRLKEYLQMNISDILIS